MKLLYKDTHSNMYALSEEYPNTILIEWIGFWEVDEILKTALDKSLEIIEKKEILILISDCRKLDAMSENVTNFLQDYWYNKAEKLGLKLEIYIGSEDFVGQISLEMLFSEVAQKDSIQTIQVEDITQAKELSQHCIKTKTYI